MVTYRPGWLQRTVSESVVLPQPQSVFISVVPVFIEDKGDAWSLVSHLRPCWCPRAMFLLGIEGDTDLRGLHCYQDHGDVWA